MGFICNRVLASSGQKEVQVRHSAIEVTVIQTPPQGPLPYLPCTTLPGRKDINAMGFWFYDVTVCRLYEPISHTPCIQSHCGTPTVL